MSEHAGLDFDFSSSEVTLALGWKNQDEFCAKSSKRSVTEFGTLTRFGSSRSKAPPIPYTPVRRTYFENY